MTVYVDKPFTYWRGKVWCHMFADSIDELHKFAKRIGMRREWFQNHAKLPHYDITESRRVVALQKGAQPCDKYFVVERIRQHAKERQARRVARKIPNKVEL